MTTTVPRIAVIAALAVLFAIAGGVAAGQSTTQAPTDNGTVQANASGAAPGAQLAGVVAVQGVEVRSEVEERRFGLQLAAARSNSSRVAIVADRVQTLRAETTALQDRRQELLEARRNGSIGPARFRVEMATLGARAGTVASAAERTRSVAVGLDQDRLADRGVNVTAIEALQRTALNASGPEAAAIARTIGGPAAGRGLTDRPGPPIEPPPTGPRGPNRTTGSAAPPTTTFGDTPTRGGGPDGAGPDRGDGDRGPPVDAEPPEQPERGRP